MRQYLPLFLVLFAGLGSAWYGTGLDFDHRIPINCSNTLNFPVVINGSKGFNLLGATQTVWINCTSDTYVYYNNTAFTIASDTANRSFDVEGGNMTGVNPANVWTSPTHVWHMGDLSGEKGGDLTKSGNATFATVGKIWNHSTLDGDGDTFGFTAGNPPSNFGIQMWINRTDDEGRDLFEYSVSSAGGYGLTLPDTRQLNAYFYPSATPVKCGSSNNSLNSTEYNLVGYSQDGSRLWVYINGEIVANCAGGGTPSGTTRNYKYLGSFGIPGINGYKGWIDEVRMYNRNLTVEEINKSYQNGISTVGFGTLGATETLPFDYYAEGYTVNGSEGTTATFTLAVINSSSMISTANLTFNGTTYPVLSSIDGTNYTFSKGITLPQVNTDTDLTFNWSFAVNGTVYTTTNHNFKIVNVKVTNCSTAGDKRLDFYIRNELTNNLLSVDSVVFFNVTVGSGSASYGATNTNKNNFSVCISAPNQTAIADAIIYYNNSSFSPRYYFLDDSSVATGTTNISLYLLPTTQNSRNITINVQESSGSYAQDYYVNVLRFFGGVNNGTSKVVEVGITDSQGRAYATIETDMVYTFQVIKDGVVVATRGPSIWDSAQTSITITVEDIELSEYFDYLGKVGYSCVASETAQTIDCSITDTSGLSVNVCFNVYIHNTTGKHEVQSECSSSSSTSFRYLVTNTSIRYFYEMYTDYPSSTQLWASGYWDFGSPPLWGDMGLVISAVMIIVFSLGFATVGPEFVPAGALIGLMFPVGMGLIKLEYGAYIGVILLGAVLIFTTIKLRG